MTGGAFSPLRALLEHAHLGFDLAQPPPHGPHIEAARRSRRTRTPRPAAAPPAAARSAAADRGTNRTRSASAGGCCCDDARRRDSIASTRTNATRPEVADQDRMQSNGRVRKHMALRPCPRLRQIQVVEHRLPLRELDAQRQQHARTAAGTRARRTRTRRASPAASVGTTVFVG